MSEDDSVLTSRERGQANCRGLTAFLADKGNQTSKRQSFTSFPEATSDWFDRAPGVTRGRVTSDVDDQAVLMGQTYARILDIGNERHHPVVRTLYKLIGLTLHRMNLKML